MCALTWMWVTARFESDFWSRVEGNNFPILIKDNLVTYIIYIYIFVI